MAEREGLGCFRGDFDGGLAAMTVMAADEGMMVESSGPIDGE